MDVAWSRKYDQTGFMPPGRPKRWRDKCFEVLQTSIAARLATVLDFIFCLTQKNAALYVNMLTKALFGFAVTTQCILVLILIAKMKTKCDGMISSHIKMVGTTMCG